jgi:hypothetical protein
MSCQGSTDSKKPTLGQVKWKNYIKMETIVQEVTSVTNRIYKICRGIAET